RLALDGFADWCVAEMVRSSGQIDRVAAAHCDPAKEQVLKEFLQRYRVDRDSTAPTAQVLHSGKPELIARLGDDFISSLTPDAQLQQLWTRLEAVSLIVVPILIRDKAVGALSFVRCQTACSYGAADLELAAELARRVSTFGENAKLYAE